MDVLRGIEKLLQLKIMYHKVSKVMYNSAFKNKKIRAVEGQYFIEGVLVSQVQKRAKNVQKHASQVLIYQKNVSQVLIYQKTCKNMHFKFFWTYSKMCIFKVRAA